MKKQINLNAFNMAVIGHQIHGMWSHPRDRALEYASLDYWVELARLLERGLFDSIFFADNMGINDVYQTGVETAIRTAAAIPALDPLLLIPAMAHATRHLGFSVTANLTFEHPYLLARRFSTLDHLTQGRIGWNIVTGILDSGARLVGQDKLPEHDLRYTIAEEFMEVVYRFWETSWENDAVIADRATRLYADPAKVHPVHFHGTHYRANGIYPVAPSPQRTPVLFQAGSSPRGSEFAGKHAECVFIGGHNKAFTAHTLKTIRQHAERHGRAGTDVLGYQGLIVITGKSRAEAQDKFEEFQRYVSLEAALTNLSGSAGIDLSQFDLDEPLQNLHSNARQTILASITGKRSDEIWTLRELLARIPLGNRQALIVGSPADVVDELEDWIEQTGVDGFNIARIISHETIQDFVDLIVPELQNRGRFKTAYAPGALRQKLFNRPHPHLKPPHPGALAPAHLV